MARKACIHEDGTCPREEGDLLPFWVFQSGLVKKSGQGLSGYVQLF